LHSATRDIGLSAASPLTSVWKTAGTNCCHQIISATGRPAAYPTFTPRPISSVLSRVFRGKFVEGLRNAFHRGELKFYGNLLPLAQPRAFSAWLRLLFRHDWVVYSKRPFGGPEHVLRYLGAYTHRVAISNSRLVALSEGNVTFRWRDSAHGNKKRHMTLGVEEFLRRFLLHLLPPGFVRIRNFGFLANRNRATLLPLCFQLLSGSEQTAPSATSPSAGKTHSLWNCLVCGGTMHVAERLSAAQLLLRSDQRTQPAHSAYVPDLKRAPVRGGKFPPARSQASSCSPTHWHSHGEQFASRALRDRDRDTGPGG